MNKNFVSIKINAESNNIIEFNGKKITEKEFFEEFFMKFESLIEEMKIMD